MSETLAPSMLQFLQYKIFGRHKVPEGWIVVTAGNPPEYNKGVEVRLHVHPLEPVPGDDVDMEDTGVKEGILFLDEINCVSETLAPSMLQFLQYKIFGRRVWWVME